MISIPSSVLARQVAGAILSDLHQITAHANSLLFYGKPTDTHLHTPEIAAEEILEAMGPAAPRLETLLKELNQ